MKEDRLSFEDKCDKAAKSLDKTAKQIRSGGCSCMALGCFLPIILIVLYLFFVTLF